MSDVVSDKVGFQAEVDASDKESNVRAELAPEEHAHLSVGDILRGTAVHELNPFERKAALINA
jgi:hypothetical protein